MPTPGHFLDCSCLGNPPLLVAPISEISFFMSNALSDTACPECWRGLAPVGPALTVSPCPVRAIELGRAWVAREIHIRLICSDSPRDGGCTRE